MATPCKTLDLGGSAFYSIGIELVLSLNCLAMVVVGIPSPTKFIFPNREEKAGEKVLSQHFYKNALSQRLQQPSAAE